MQEGEVFFLKSDFQTRIKHEFPLYFLYELLMSLRSKYKGEVNLTIFFFLRQTKA